MFALYTVNNASKNSGKPLAGNELQLLAQVVCECPAKEIEVVLCLFGISVRMQKIIFKQLIRSERCWHVTTYSNWCIAWMWPEARSHFARDVWEVISTHFPLVCTDMSYWQLMLWLETFSLLLHCSINEIKFTSLWQAEVLHALFYVCYLLHYMALSDYAKMA